MSENDLLSYLRQTKNILKSVSRVSELHIVRGNEACDLDSAVCAVVYAFYLHKTQSESSAPVIPLLNIVEADYALHTEVTYALQESGITQELLVFQDQVNLTYLHDNQQLVLTLVDHNAMSPKECSLEDAVCEVIDHHTQVKEFPLSVNVTLELVGSCCSLVAEKLLNDARFDLDPLVARLLLGTILLDTACLVEGKQKDVTQAERLETLLPDLSRQETYNALVGARRQISGLSAFDVLRKDLKVIASDKLKITVSSVPCLIEVFLATEDAGSAFEDFSRLHQADVVVVMAIDLATGGQIHRQVLVYSINPSYRDQVIDALKATGPLLAIGRPISTPFKHLRAFEQDNSKSSRKKLLPIIARFITDGQSPGESTVPSSNEAPPSRDTDPGIGQDSAGPEAPRDISSVPGDESSVTGDVGSGAVEEVPRSQAGGDVCSSETHCVLTRPEQLSCNGVMGHGAVTTGLSGNVVAMMIASDMEGLKSHERQKMIATDTALNVVSGRIAAEMKQMECTQNEVIRKSVTVAGNNVVAQKIAVEMQLQENTRRQGERDSKQVLERADGVTQLKGGDHGDFAPSEVTKPCHLPGALVNRGTDRTRKKKNLSVRHSDTDLSQSSVQFSDTDMKKSDSCENHVSPEDRVLAAADQLVTAVVNSAIDLYLDPSTQEYAHPETGPGTSEEEAERGSNGKGDEPSVKVGMEMNPTEPMEGLRATRPTDLESTPKKKIVPLAGELLHQEDIEVSVGSSSSSEVGLSVEGEKTPDDLTTPDIANDSVFGSLDWESDTACSPVEPIPEYTAQEEFDDERSWKTVQFGNKCYRIDMKVIEPYKKVLSHGGYYGDGFNAIVVLTACHLPDKRRRDYNYVMDNLFLYVLNTLDLLVVDDYMIVYFHGAAPSHKIPTVRWLKRCYDLIDRRLRKNLKQLVIVHPTLWLKTVALMSRPFISSKFLSKLKYVKNLNQLKDVVPMEYIHIPDEVKQYDENKSPSASSPN